MNIGKTSFSIIALSAIALLSVGCAPKQSTTLTPTKIERSQELFITTDIKKTKVKKKKDFQYEINLNNTTKTEASLMLKNRGDKTLTISGLNLKDPSHLLKSSNNCNKPLKGGESCNLTIKFTGKNEGRFTSILEIASNDIKHKVTNILINAESKDKFHGYISPIKSTKVKQERTVKLKFNALNKKQYIQIENDGLGLLELKAPKRSGEDASSFKYTTDCKTSLKVGQKCEVTVTYDPTKKEGFSDATITIPSNGNITPSRYIRLEGYSKPFSIAINKFVVSDNIGDFVDDYFESTKTYYFRTIYQGNTDRFFTNGVKAEIAKYFKANNFKLASSPAKADRVVTIYPSVTTTKNEESNDLAYNIVIDGYLTTKAKGIKTASNSTIALDYNSTIGDTKFSALTLNNMIFSKEKFQFGLDIQVDNVADEKEVATTVADIVVSKLFNVLGLKDTKGTN